MASNLAWHFQAWEQKQERQRQIFAEIQHFNLESQRLKDEQLERERLEDERVLEQQRQKAVRAVGRGLLVGWAETVGAALGLCSTPQGSVSPRGFVPPSRHSVPHPGALSPTPGLCSTLGLCPSPFPFPFSHSLFLFLFPFSFPLPFPFFLSFLGNFINLRNMSFFLAD